MNRKNDLEQSTQCVQSFAADEVNFISVQCHVCYIRTVGTVGTEIRVIHKNNKLRKMNIQLHDGVLDVKEQDRVAIYEVFGLLELSKDKELLIEIPKSYTGSIQLNSVCENIECNNTELSECLSIHTKTGKVRLHNIQAESVSVEAEHGNIQAFGISADKNITMKSANGDILCEPCGCASDYFMQCRSCHGHCNVPTETAQGTKKIRLNSITGNIIVRFAGT